MAARVHVIWNPRSRLAARSQSTRALLDAAAEVVLHETSNAANAADIARQAAEDGAEVVIAAGGDGTVNLVVQALEAHFERTALGVLPMGSGNDLARSLAMPLDPLEAARYIITAPSERIRKIDLAELRTAEHAGYFANMATGGNTGHGLELLTNEMKARWGPLCYLRGALQMVSQLKVFSMGVQFDDQAVERIDALNIFVANGSTSGGGLPAAPNASLEDGLLDVVIVRDGPPIDLAAATAHFVFADDVQHELIVYRRAKRIYIDCEAPLCFTADGDANGCAPAEITVRPHALRVVVGPTYQVPSVGDAVGGF